MRASPLLALSLLAIHLSAADYPYQPVPFTDVQLTGGLLAERQQTNTRVTLPFALEQCEKSRRLQNFDLAAETMKRRASGDTTFQNSPATQYPFDDSDVYKVIEGASYCLAVHPDPDLQKRLETLIHRIAAAQEPDGYLYTWRTMHPDQPAHDWIGATRWTKDPELSHELYNLGHLYEAGFAHQQATGSSSLMDICLKSAELLQHDFGDGNLRIAPGHQVIEMGLAKLYRKTGDTRWIHLARRFIDARGHGGSDYSQDHQPAADQREAVGHAVRANYLYSGMADVAALTDASAYQDALSGIWENVVSRKLHLTGGCGARSSGEAYGDDYELPHRCYNETCAAIAFMFWNHRMFLRSGEGKYMDVFERTLYNGFLSGVSLSGDRFFYPNPLEYDGHQKNNHGFAGRAPWFGCACCPPNVLRTLASLGGYALAVKGDSLFVNLYTPSESRIDVAGKAVSLTQQTDYPWNGKITLTVRPPAPTEFTLALRIPGWVRDQPLPSDLYHYEDSAAAAWTATVNGEAVPLEVRNGYLHLRRQWSAGDSVILDLPMPVRRVAGKDQIAATRGQSAIERGPVVYCLEGADNEARTADAILPPTARFAATWHPDLLGGITTVAISGAARAVRDAKGAPASQPATLTAIPYASWNNRGLSPMTVWLPRDPSGARLPALPTLASTAKLSVSFNRGGMETSPINDQQLPQNATDGFPLHFDFWPNKGTREWIQYDFTKATSVRQATVSWFDDTGVGECRVPKSWRITTRDVSGKWIPVKSDTPYRCEKSTPITVKFPPVTTQAIRLEIELPEGFSSGIYEWSVE